MDSDRGSVLLYLVLALAILGILSGISHSIYSAGAKAERAIWQEREAKINTETAIKIEAANKRVRATEQSIATALAAESQRYQTKIKEKDDALTIALNSLRAGTGRLFVNTTCPAVDGDPESSAAAGTGGRDGAARAELSAADSEFLLELGSEADGVVHQLTACQAIVRADRPGV